MRENLPFRHRESLSNTESLWKLPIWTVKEEEVDSAYRALCENWLSWALKTTGLPRWNSGKESAASARDARDSGLIPGLGTSPGVWNGNPLQYSCLEKIPRAKESGELHAVHGFTRVWSNGVTEHKQVPGMEGKKSSENLWEVHYLVSTNFWRSSQIEIKTNI